MAEAKLQALAKTYAGSFSWEGDMENLTE